MLRIASSIVRTPQGTLEPGVVEIEGATATACRLLEGEQPQTLYTPHPIDVDAEGRAYIGSKQVIEELKN